MDVLLYVLLDFWHQCVFRYDENVRQSYLNDNSTLDRLSLMQCNVSNTCSGTGHPDVCIGQRLDAPDIMSYPAPISEVETGYNLFSFISSECCWIIHVCLLLILMKLYFNCDIVNGVAATRPKKHGLSDSLLDPWLSYLH